MVKLRGADAEMRDEYARAGPIGCLLARVQYRLAFFLKPQLCPGGIHACGRRKQNVGDLVGVRRVASIAAI